MDWYESYSIGIAEIDKQHKELVNTVSKMQKSLKAGSVDKEVGNTLKFLVDYTKRHFADEERLMRDINFPDYENHKIKHGKLVEQITDILLGLKKGKPVNGYELIDFLTDWLINHIRHEDKKIGKAMQERGKEVWDGK